MQTFIFKEKYFYDKILLFSKSVVTHELENKNSRFYQKEIVKKDGFRQLNCLKRDTIFYEIQQNLRRNFLDTVSIPDYVYGFIPEKSYKDFLEPHKKNQYFLRLDIKNFFSTIKKEDITDVFSYYFQLEDISDRNRLLEIFSDIVTLNEVVPQGGVTSPAISNIIFRRLDIRIHNYCERLNIEYSRYADDLLFSANKDLVNRPFFIKKISKIINSSGFYLNNNKTKISSQYISLNGFVIENGENIRLSRKKLKDIAAVLFILENVKKTDTDILIKLNKLNIKRTFSSLDNVQHYLNGYRAFFIQLLDKNNESHYKIKKYINRIEKVVVNLFT